MTLPGLNFDLGQDLDMLRDAVAEPMKDYHLP